MGVPLKVALKELELHCVVLDLDSLIDFAKRLLLRAFLEITTFSLNPPRKIPRAAPAAVAAAAAAVKKRKIISTNIFTNVVQIFIG